MSIWTQEGRALGYRGPEVVLLLPLILAAQSCTENPQSSSRLELSPLSNVSVAQLGVLTGAAIDSEARIAIWRPDSVGFVVDEKGTISSVSSLKNPKDSRTIAMQPTRKSATFLRAAGGLLESVRGESIVGTRAVKQRLRAVFQRDSLVSLLLSEGPSNFKLATTHWDLHDWNEVPISLGDSSFTNDIAPLSIAIREKDVWIAGANDSLHVWCLRTDGAAQSRHSSSLQEANSLRQNFVPKWKVSAVVPLDRGFLVGLADLRSARRRIARFDKDCSPVITRETADGFLPAASSVPRRLLIGTRPNGGGELVVMSWRWEEGNEPTFSRSRR